MHVYRAPLHKCLIMRGFLFSAALCALVPFTAAAAVDEADATSGKAENVFAEDEINDKLDSVVVSASRAGKSTPVTYTMVGKQQLRQNNPINSLPMMLNLQPSVVSVNEGGTGLGYSKMTIRGSKGSQVNVTLNGITLNDAESQEVFWVNIPALTSLISSVQLQRGLGTSANGAGAFGASVNMSTASVTSDPHVFAEVAAGSYNTFMTTVSAGTGLTKSGIYFDFAYSRNYTDGYIRNAKARVQSAFAALGWMNETNSLRLTYLMGDQHTGITWNGIDLDTYETDRRYNSAGEYTDEFGNVHYYDNETDNYTQHHIQLNYTHQFPKNVVWSTTLNFTKGDGYYENYKAGESMSDYNLPELPSSPVIDPATGEQMTDDKGNPVFKDGADFITREAMDNYYLVFNSDVKYTSDKLAFTGGINLSRYDGGHFGNILWCSRLGDDYDYSSYNRNDSWYRNNGLKQEVNVFARAEYTPLDWLTAYVDLQYRGVSLKMKGPDDDAGLLDYRTSWDFFNPRAGLTFSWRPEHKAYISAAMGNREPGRSDIKENIKNVNSGNRDGISIRPEQMVDVEIGYQYTGKKVTASANLYFMEYFDMLLETGRLSDVGYALKENVGRAYRRGIELAAAWQAAPWFRLDANATFSMNKILDYVGYCDNIRYVENEEGGLDLDYPGGQTAVEFGKTDMLMSPSIIGMLQLSFQPFAATASNSLKSTTLSINGKYVGRQYMDNTSSAERAIPGYFVSNLSVSHEFNVKGGKLGISGYINNLFNNMYYADGGAYSMYNVDTKKVEADVWVYPQAPVNFMLKLSYRF